MNLPLSSVFGAGASYVSGDIIMNTEISEETIINFVNVFKILYQVAQREHQNGSSRPMITEKVRQILTRNMIIMAIKEKNHESHHSCTRFLA